MNKKTKIQILTFALASLITVGLVPTVLPITANASTLTPATSTVQEGTSATSTVTETVSNPTITPSTASPNSTVTSSNVTHSSDTISRTPNRAVTAKETSQSSNTKMTAECVLTAHSIDGYSFSLWGGGATVLSAPKSETTVVIPNSIKYCGQDYPVTSIELSDQTKFWLMKTLVLPPGVKTVFPSDVAVLGSLKNIIYTCQNNPIDPKSDHYADMMSYGVSITKGDYSSYQADVPDFAQLDDTINISDDFRMEEVSYNNVTYSLRSGRYATVYNIEADSNGDVKIVDHIEFNGVVYPVTNLACSGAIHNYNIKNIYLSHMYILGKHSLFWDLPNLEHVYYNSSSNPQPNFLTDGSLLSDCNISTVTVINSDDESLLEVLPIKCDVPVTSVSTKTYDKTSVLPIVFVFLVSCGLIVLTTCRRRIIK